MLYTRKGDNGTTKTLNSKPGARISKCSCQTESLGALDELNSFLGLVKVRSGNEPRIKDWSLPSGAGKGTKTLADIIHWTQNCLFIIQAEVAGSRKTIQAGQIEEMEAMIDRMEKELPPIKTFFISGGTELAALLDIGRTLARKAERRVVAAEKGENVKVSAVTKAFLNRLSSLLYVLARFSNFYAHITEEAPWYDK